MKQESPSTTNITETIIAIKTKLLFFVVLATTGGACTAFTSDAFPLALVGRPVPAPTTSQRCSGAILSRETRIPFTSSASRRYVAKNHFSLPPPTSRPLMMSEFDNYDDGSGDGPRLDDEEDEPNRLSDEELEAAMGEWDEKVARLNTVHLTGRVGNDPEPRYFDDGKVVVNLSLATRRKYHGTERMVKDIRSGDEETDWYYLEIWGQTAEFVSKYVDKGARVGVIGSLQINDWTDKATGEPRNGVTVVVREFDILESREESNLRRGNRGGGRGRGSSSYGGGGGDRGGRYGNKGQDSYDNSSDDDEWPSSAGSGGYF